MTQDLRPFAATGTALSVGTKESSRAPPQERLPNLVREAAMSSHGMPQGHRNARAPRRFTPARIVALCVIALLVAGLAYVRFAPDDAVSLPSGAEAGDLQLEPCDYATEDGSYAADCGTLVVPENRADPQSRLIALPVTRIRARSADPAEPVFRLEGGPGGTNMHFDRASRFADDRDVVLVGYRGVDGSSVLDCPEVESALKHSTDFLGQDSFRAYADGFRSCADRLRGDGVDLDGYSMSQQADDLEAAREALGYDQIDLLSESAGTRLALIYSWRYPANVHRSVQIGVNPPGHFFWDGPTTDRQIGRYAAMCARDADCSTRTDDLAASMRRIAGDMPDRWWFLPIKEANVRIAAFFGLFETTPEVNPISGPAILDAWLAADEGDPSGFWFASLAGDLLFPTMFVWGEYAAIGTTDSLAVDAYYAAGGDPGSILGNPGTDFVWGGGLFADAWPTSPDDAEYRQVPRSEVETLLVGGTLDVSTPAVNATRDLLPFLPNGRQVLLPRFGHSTSFWSDQPDAGTRLINTYLDSGRVDTSGYSPQRIDFTPSVTPTNVAKVVAGVMVTLALVAVLSLLGMAWRVHRRGRFGRMTSAALRSAYVVVLGLGGWFLGALIVLTTMSGVTIDNALLAVLSVGIPIGLGVYWAWVDRDWDPGTKTTGFVAAAVGALVGAWLGVTVTEGLVALLTAIVGAAVGANLAVLVLDIALGSPDRRAASIEAPAVPAVPAGAAGEPAIPGPRQATGDEPVGPAQASGDDPGGERR
jgi:pimeloyl-ACP methyl ester carboxylesterase